jgi:acetyltransferase-like isoleucine patch superfamily enzyme
LALALSGAIPPYTANSLRVVLLRAGGLRIGERTGVGGRLWVAGGPRPASRIAIGADCFLNDGCRFDVVAPVTIDDGVFVGHDVAVITTSHELGSSTRRAGRVFAEPVVIGRGSWIAARATILGGVTIGEGAVVAAGAVVTASVPPNTLVGGTPAVVIRELDEGS